MKTPTTALTMGPPAADSAGRGKAKRRTRCRRESKEAVLELSEVLDLGIAESSLLLFSCGRFFVLLSVLALRQAIY
jgi:hypothetical protein